MENNTKKVSPGLASQSAKRRTKGKTNKDTVDMEKTKKETGSRRIQKNKGRQTWKKNEKEKIRQTICRSVVSR